MTDEVTRYKKRKKEQEQFIATAEYVQSLLDKITQLEKENAELKAHCKAVDEVNEKMRCCGNCKHVYEDCVEKDCKQNKYKHWELVE